MEFNPLQGVRDAAVELLHTLVAVHSEVHHLYPWSIYAIYVHQSCSYFSSWILEIEFMVFFLIAHLNSTVLRLHFHEIMTS